MTASANRCLHLAASAGVSGDARHHRRGYGRRDARLEQENIQRAIECVSGRIYGPGGAAELLGLRPTTLAYRMKALGIPRPRT